MLHLDVLLTVLAFTRDIITLLCDSTGLTAAVQQFLGAALALLSLFTCEPLRGHHTHYALMATCVLFCFFLNLIKRYKGFDSCS